MEFPLAFPFASKYRNGDQISEYAQNDSDCDFKSNLSMYSTEKPMVVIDDRLMDSFEAARHRLLLNAKSAREHIDVESVVGIYSFIYYLKVFSSHCQEFWEAHTLLMEQRRSSCYKRCMMHCEFSLTKIIWPMPYSTWKAWGQALSPFIHWKSPIFLQSLGIALAMTICGLLAIYPPLHEYNPLGYWASLTVGALHTTTVL